MGSRELIQATKFRKAVEPSFDVAELEVVIEKAYLKQKRKDGKKTKKSFSPSSIGYGHGNCPRYWYLAFSGAEFVETTDSLGIAVMANGSATHQRLQSLFKEAGILVADEVEVNFRNPPIRGFLDVMIRMQPGGKVVVGEIKSARSESFLFRENTQKPAINHLIQLLIYMHITKKDEGFILYENKNDQTILVLSVSMNEKNKKILDDVLEWMRTVHKNFEEGSLPKAPWTKRNKACRGCPVFDECWSKPKGTVDIPALEVSG